MKAISTWREPTASGKTRLLGDAKVPFGLQVIIRAPGNFSSFIDVEPGKIDEILALGSGVVTSRAVIEDREDSSKSSFDFGATTSLTMCSRVVSDKSVLS